MNVKSVSVGRACVSKIYREGVRVRVRVCLTSRTYKLLHIPTQ